MTNKAIFLIFPHQLFENVELLIDKEIYLIEEYLFFKQYNFHQQKIIFHRATMQYYLHYLQTKKITVSYVNSIEEKSDVRNLIKLIAISNTKEIQYYDTIDNWLEKRISTLASNKNIKLTQLTSPLFINDSNTLAKYFDTKKKFFQTDFYIQQRKDLKLLVEKDGKPEGGKWTYDTENRVKYPKDKVPPKLLQLKENNFIKEAKKYCSEHYNTNLGNNESSLVYPTTHQEAKDWLQQFLVNRFSAFGTYEDAIMANEIILHHSVLTPMLNIGLLSPIYVLDTTIKYAKKYDIALNNTEGFVRQILGWREFIRGVYAYQGTKQRTTNYWKFNKKIPKSFYIGNTGIIPVDDTIKKVLKTGYCHHIERLMVLGNFMLLCEFDPNDVHRWFMELFIDAYDWVMVPNVYGMSQFADGGLMATKPYISSSNYIFKMSDYKKTKQSEGWDVIWDGLFWRFMHKHRAFFLQNPRLGMLVKTFDKMSEEKRNKHLQLADKFLSTL